MAEIGRASAILASGTIVSRLLGFVNMFVLAAAIGSFGASADTFAAANQLPNTVHMIVVGSVISAVLVPQVVRASLREDGGQAYINKLVTLSLIVLLAATALALALAPILVQVTVSGFSGPKIGLTTVFAYWCLPQIFFYGLYTVLGEILNARKVFGPTTWAPVFNNVIAIGGFAAFIALFGADPAGERSVLDFTGGMVTTIGATASLGVAGQALVLIVFWRRAGLHYRPDFHWRGVGLRDTGRMAGWTFGMLAVTTFAGLAKSNVASRAATGDPSVNVLAKSWLIFMLPHSVVTVSVATAYFTRMSEAAAARRFQAVKADLSAAVRTVNLLIILATGGLCVLALPFARLFTDTYYQTASMGWVIIATVVGLVSFTVLFIVQRTFYALGDTRTPFLFTLAQAIIFALLAVACAFLPSPFIAVGLAMAQSLATTAQMAIAWHLLRRRLGPLGGRAIAASLGRFTLAGIPSVLVGSASLFLLGGLTPGGFGLASKGSAIVVMAAIGTLMVIVYFAVLVAMRVPELRGALAPVLPWLRRLRNRG
jgi:putative peptidoglycan lipid II flippase